MRNTLTAFALLCLSAVPALAQTAPGWSLGYVPTPTEWNAQWAAKRDAASIIAGCAGNGTTDDTVCVQAALTAGGTIYLGRHTYKITSALTASGKVAIIGETGGGGIYNTTCTSGFVAGATNLNLLTLSSDHSRVQNVCFNMNAAGANTGGAAITVGPSTQTTITDSQFNSPYVAIDATGTAGSQNVNTTIERNVVINPVFAGFRIGVNSTGQSTVDTRVTDNNVLGPNTTNTAVGLLMLDAGGIYVRGNDFFQMGVGTKAFPGTSQLVNGFFYDVMGDSSYDKDMLLDSNGGAVTFAMIANGWISTGTSQHFLITNTGGGGVSNVSISNMAVVMHGGAAAEIGIDIEAGINIGVQNSMFYTANNSASSIGIKVGAAAQFVTIQGNKFGSGGGSLGTGISVATGPGPVNVSGNTFAGNVTAPLVYVPTAAGTDTAVVHHNLGVDNISPTVASAGTITLPVNPTVIVSGNTTVTQIIGGWSDRYVRLVATGAGGFAITGNVAGNGKVCGAGLAVPQYGQASLHWVAALSCWVVG